jgi:hypothetical protein
LRLLTPEDWERRGIHEKQGVQTLQTIVADLVGHEEEHTAQLIALSQR